MILLCPACGQPGENALAGRKAYPIRFCPRCNTVFDQAKDVAGRPPIEPQADAAVFYDGIDQARQALNPTPTTPRDPSPGDQEPQP